MLRVFVIVLVALCLVGGIAYGTGMLNDALGIETSPAQRTGSVGATKTEVSIGEPLYEARELPKLQEGQPRNYREIVVEPCHVMARDTQEISAGKDGKLSFVGMEKKPGVEPPANPPREYKKAEVFEGRPELVTYFYRPWEEGDEVRFGQMVAKIEPALAKHEVASKEIKILIAKADLEGTISVLREASAKLARTLQLRASRGSNVVTDEEIGVATATVDKYKAEKLQKEEAVNGAVYEKLQADIVLSMYDLHCMIPGKSIIRKIQKYTGEQIKAQEPILQLYGISRLRVEGSVDSQYASTLQKHKNAQCYLEPSDDLAPALELMKAHRAEITGVAFCADGQHFVSGSEDGTVCVWQRGQVAPKHQLVQSSPVRSVACSPKGAWLIVGCADGSITLWDLTQPEQPVKVMADQHRGPVTALAFSPDGDYFASGAEDNTIVMWNATGAMLYPFDADHGVSDPHQGTITSLNFTPQCTLVSAARDNTLRVWTLGKNGARQALAPISNRGGTVSQLGISPDGLMLFDRGKSIQLISMADRSTVCVLDNLAGSNPFDTLAMFTPDGSLMLTGGAGEGRLHLWKTPTRNERAYQVRELVTKDRSGITSAAFAPGNQPSNKRFAVTGSKEGFVHLWELPDNQAVQKHVITRDALGQPLQLDLVEQQQNAGKTRITTNVLNPQTAEGYRLRPGQRVTVVVVLPLAQ